jgi:hypothetical protein
MRQMTLFVLLFAFALPTTAQDTVQLTRPAEADMCTAFQYRHMHRHVAELQSGPRAARREEIQLYVNRQKQLASDAATAPLQKQIADLNRLIADQQAQLKKLQDQMQANAAATLQEKQADAANALAAKTAAHKEGLWTGTGIGAGGTLVLLGIIFGVVQLSKKFTITKKLHAASA